MSDSDRAPISHTTVFDQRYGDMLLSAHEELKGARAWREAQGRRLEALEYAVGRVGGDVGHLCTRVVALEQMIAGNGKPGLLAWKVATDERLHDLEQAVDGRASEADLEVLQARLSERAASKKERISLRAAQIAALAVVIAALVGAAASLPTSCSHRTERTGTTQPAP